MMYKNRITIVILFNVGAKAEIGMRAIFSWPTWFHKRYVS